jgi:hypothetical protein
MKKWSQRLLVLAATCALSLGTFALPLSRTTADGVGSYTVLDAQDATVTVNGEPAGIGTPYSGDDVVEITSTGPNTDVWVAYEDPANYQVKSTGSDAGAASFDDTWTDQFIWIDQFIWTDEE